MLSLDPGMKVWKNQYEKENLISLKNVDLLIKLQNKRQGAFSVLIIKQYHLTLIQWFN